MFAGEKLVAQPAQSILQGSNQLHHLDLELFRVTSIRFPGGLRLGSHFHPRACLAVVLQGQVEKAFRASRFELGHRLACTMPPEERHSDRFAGGGAHLLVVEPAPTAAASQLLAPCAGLLAEVNQVGNPYLFLLAQRLENELRRPDTLSPLVVNGLALELLAVAARQESPANGHGPMPLWLAQARDYLHDHFTAPLRMADLAGTVGVHPVYLARTFRRYFDASPGEYLRRLRVEWVKERLLLGNQPLSQLAQEAGFADQSHLTRLFKARYGVTPGQLRPRGKNQNWATD